MKFLLAVLVLTYKINVLFASSSTFNSDIFTVDDAGLHVTLNGTTKNGAPWDLHEVRETDISMYQDLYSDPAVMQFFLSSTL